MLQKLTLKYKYVASLVLNDLIACICSRLSAFTRKVLVFGFDLLYLNGEPLIRLPLAKRREKLRESFHKVDGQFDFATSRDPTSIEEIEEFLEESIKGKFPIT